MNMPLDYINALYQIAKERQLAEEEERKKAEAEGKTHIDNNTAMAIEDEMEAAFG